jgi:hypothetical protein
LKNLSKLFRISTVPSLGLILAATGIFIQILAGVASVSVPVGALVMLGLAALNFFQVWRWTITLSTVVAVLILIGTFIAPGLGKRLSNPAEIGPFIGTLFQLSGLVVVIISGLFIQFYHQQPKIKKGQF